MGLKDIITNPQVTVKVKPVLLSFGGLPNSGKTAAIDAFRNNYVDKSPLKPAREEIETPRADGISSYEVVAANLSSKRIYSIKDVTTETSFTPTILSAFKELFFSKKIVPLLDADASAVFASSGIFNHPDLDEHLSFIYRYLSQQDFIAKAPELTEDEKKNAEYLIKSLPEGIANVNIWDFAINKTIRHILSALQGHLYNHHMWLFLDLERDLGSLNKPPERSHPADPGNRDAAVLMRWRPRLHYLLRSCRISESKAKDKEQRRMCTLFAKHDGMEDNELQKKVKELKSKVQPVAKHVGVLALLEEKIETFDSKKFEDCQQLYQKFQHVINDTPFERIPVAWVFLRSLFFRFNWKFIARCDLEEMAKKCNMEESLNDFCKFYTSFGSILDLSLVDPNYQHVIVKPIDFLKSLDSLLNPDDKILEDYPNVAFGIVPEVACKKLFDGYWCQYMEALVSLNLAIRVNSHNLEMKDENSAHDDLFYYIPVTRKEELIEDPDPTSVHIITSINTPHIFKQVTFTKHLLALLPKAKLVRTNKPNQTIITDPEMGSTVTLVSHSPATKLKIENPSEKFCSCIVEVYKRIAEKAKREGITVQYKFVKICAAGHLQDVQSIPSSKYHILPDDLCDSCKIANHYDDDKLIKAWNEALKKVWNLNFLNITLILAK